VLKYAPWLLESPFQKRRYEPVTGSSWWFNQSVHSALNQAAASAGKGFDLMRQKHNENWISISRLTWDNLHFFVGVKLL